MQEQRIYKSEKHGCQAKQQKIETLWSTLSKAVSTASRSQAEVFIHFAEVMKDRQRHSGLLAYIGGAAVKEERGTRDGVCSATRGYCTNYNYGLLRLCLISVTLFMQQKQLWIALRWILLL